MISKDRYNSDIIVLLSKSKCRLTGEVVVIAGLVSVESGA